MRETTAVTIKFHLRFALSILLTPLALGSPAIESPVSFSNVTLVKEYPLSIFVQQDNKRFFLNKSTISTEHLKDLREGKPVGIINNTTDFPNNSPDQPPIKTGIAEHNFLANLKSYISNPPKKNPQDNFRMPDSDRIINYYPMWKPEEVVAFNSWHNKRHAAKYFPSFNYVTTGELIIETVEDTSVPPAAHSNKELWQSKGLKARKQDGSNCSLFSMTMVGDILLIKEGFASPKTDPTFLWKSQKDKGDRYGGTRTPSITVGICSNGIYCINNKHRITKPLQIRNIRTLLLGPSEFPIFVRKLLAGSSDKDLRDGFLKKLLKREVFMQRPIVLNLPFPDAKIFDKKHKKDGKQEIILRPKVYAGQVVFHSVVAIGYKPDPENPEHLLIEILNTWGPEWGNQGYAWISTAYIDLWDTDSSSVNAYSVDFL